MLQKVDPLRRELDALEKKARETKAKGEEMTKIIQELEESITQYKEEYAVLISEANAIKADLATVEAKVCVCVCVCMHGCVRVYVCVCVCDMGRNTSII